MKSTPIEDLIDGDSVTDEEEVERDISRISDDIRNSSTNENAGSQLQSEIEYMRSQLEELKQQNNPIPSPALAQASTKTQAELDESDDSIFESVLKYKRVDDIIEIVSLISVYVIFTMNVFIEFIDNMIPFMFYNYNPIIKGVLFVIVYRTINFFLKKLFKGNT